MGKASDWSFPGPKSQQIINRLENHKEVCTKSGLAANLASLLREVYLRLSQVSACFFPVLVLQGGPESYPWIPETYVAEAPSGGDWSAFKKAFEKHASGDTFISAN